MCARIGLGYVPMVAPTSTDKHLDEVNQVDAPFVYCVALLGVTGARSAMDTNLAAFLDHVRSRVRHPLIDGFGISRPEHLTSLRGHAHGAIVASAIADLLETNFDDAERTSLRDYLHSLKVACQSSRRRRRIDGALIGRGPLWTCLDSAAPGFIAFPGEQRRLPITEISLAQVADQYLAISRGSTIQIESFCALRQYRRPLIAAQVTTAATARDEQAGG